MVVSFRVFYQWKFLRLIVFFSTSPGDLHTPQQSRCSSPRIVMHAHIHPSFPFRYFCKSHPPRVCSLRFLNRIHFFLQAIFKTNYLKDFSPLLFQGKIFQKCYVYAFRRSLFLKLFIWLSGCAQCPVQVQAPSQTPCSFTSPLRLLT